MKLHAWRVTPHTAGFYFTNRHLIFFKRRNPWGNGSAWGVHHRVRLRSGEWRQTVVRLFERAEPIPGGVGAWKHEFVQYRTKSASGAAKGGNRTTIKRFLRLKWGLGGERADPGVKAYGGSE